MGLLSSVKTYQNTHQAHKYSAAIEKHLMFFLVHRPVHLKDLLFFSEKKKREKDLLFIQVVEVQHRIASWICCTWIQLVVGLDPTATWTDPIHYLL